jgi:hypothetical protein
MLVLGMRVAVFAQLCLVIIAFAGCGKEGLRTRVEGNWEKSNGVLNLASDGTFYSCFTNQSQVRIYEGKWEINGKALTLRTSKSNDVTSRLVLRFEIVNADDHELVFADDGQTVFWRRLLADTTNHQGPINGRLNQANWRTYHPSNPPAMSARAGRVQVRGIRLLSTQDEFDRSTEALEFAGFIGRTKLAIDKSLGPTNENFELVVQTRLTRDKRPSFELGSKGNVSQELLRKIQDGFGQLPDYRSREDDLRYEVRFAITRKT